MRKKPSINAITPSKVTATEIDLSKVDKGPKQRLDGKQFPLGDPPINDTNEKERSGQLPAPHGHLPSMPKPPKPLGGKPFASGKPGREAKPKPEARGFHYRDAA